VTGDPRKERWVGYATCNLDMTFKILNREHGENRPCGRHRLKWEANVKINAGEIGCDTVWPSSCKPSGSTLNREILG
jgi:hypothetical protein